MHFDEGLPLASLHTHPLLMVRYGGSVRLADRQASIRVDSGTRDYFLPSCLSSTGLSDIAERRAPIPVSNIDACGKAHTVLLAVVLLVRPVAVLA